MRLGTSLFASDGKLSTRHHVVVVAEEKDYVLILPTTTISAEAHRATVAGEFSPQDCRKAGWNFRCRVCPEALQWIPKSWVTIRSGYSLSEQTAQQIRKIAQIYGARSPRYTDAMLSQLELRAKAAGKERIAL